MNSKQIAQFIGHNKFLRKLGYFFIYLTTLREWHIRRGIRLIMAQLNGNISLLDAGFGMGQHIYYVARRNPETIIFGIEQDAEQLDDFRIFLRKAGIGRVELYVGDLLGSEMTEKVDVALCCSVLEHIVDDVRALNRLADHIRADGYLLIYVPSAERRVLKGAAKRIARVAHKSGEALPHGHVRYYRPDELMTKLAQAGFTVVEQQVTYGIAGRLAYDVVTSVQYSKYFLLLFPIYLIMIHPLMLLLMMIDYYHLHEEGNGFLCIAQKRAA